METVVEITMKEHLGKMLQKEYIEAIHFIMDGTHIDVKSMTIEPGADYVIYNTTKHVYGKDTRGFPLYLYEIASEKEFTIEMAKGHLDYMRTAKDVGGNAEFTDARRTFREVMKIYDVELTEEVELWMRLTW